MHYFVANINFSASEAFINLSVKTFVVDIISSSTTLHFNERPTAPKGVLVISGEAARSKKTAA